MPGLVPKPRDPAEQAASSPTVPTNQLVALLALAPFPGTASCSRNASNSVQPAMPLPRLPLSSPLAKAKGHAQTTIDMLRQVFHLPKAQAAQQLGMGVSTLKRCCTALRIKRWPHRKLGCLKQLQDYHALHPLPDVSAQQDVIGMLQNEVDAIMQNPDHELIDEVVTKRIAKYKTTFAHKMQRNHDRAIAAKHGRHTKSEPGKGSCLNIPPDGQNCLTHKRKALHMQAVYADVCDSPVLSCVSRTNAAIGPSKQDSDNCSNLKRATNVSMVGCWSLEDVAVPDLADVHKVLSKEVRHAISDQPPQANRVLLQSATARRMHHNNRAKASSAGSQPMQKLLGTVHPVHTHAKHKTNRITVEEGSAQSTTDQIWLPVDSDNGTTTARQPQESGGSCITPEHASINEAAHNEVTSPEHKSMPPSCNKMSVQECKPSLLFCNETPAPEPESLPPLYSDVPVPDNNMLSIELPTTPMIKSEIFSPTLQFPPQSTAMVPSLCAFSPAWPNTGLLDGVINDLSNHAWMFATDLGTHEHTECVRESLHAADFLETCPAALMVDNADCFHVMNDRKSLPNLECHCQTACLDEDLNALLAVLEPVEFN